MLKRKMFLLRNWATQVFGSDYLRRKPEFYSLHLKPKIVTLLGPIKSDYCFESGLRKVKKLLL